MATDNKNKVLKSSIEREQNELACSAEREKIKGSKNLNVPTKRKQNQTCLNSAEHEGLRPKGNVPNLRFPEFSGEWEETTLKDISIINPESATLEESFIYIDLESVEKGILKKERVICRSEAPSRARRIINEGDILYQCVRPYQRNNYIHKKPYNNGKQWVASTGYAQIRTSECPHYIYHLVNTDCFNRKVIIRCTGSNYPAINSEDLSFIRFYYTPIKEEQKKIAKLLSLLDDRIATQNKIIDKLQSLIKGIRNEVFGKLRKSIGFNAIIGNVLNYEQPQSYIVEDTEYTNKGTPVLTANKTFVLGYTTEINGIYRNGDCIIFDDFTLDCKYVDFPFKVKSSAIKILTAKNKGLLRYTYEFLMFLDLKTDEHKRHYIAETQNQAFILPNTQIIGTVAHIFSALSLRIEYLIKQRNNFEKQKQYLLHQMFI